MCSSLGIVRLGSVSLAICGLWQQEAGAKAFDEGQNRQSRAVVHRRKGLKLLTGFLPDHFHLGFKFLVHPIIHLFAWRHPCFKAQADIRLGPFCLY